MKIFKPEKEQYSELPLPTPDTKIIKILPPLLHLFLLILFSFADVFESRFHTFCHYTPTYFRMDFLKQKTFSFVITNGTITSIETNKRLLSLIICAP